LIARLKQGWRELRHGEPGRRFRSRYDRRRAASGGTARRSFVCILGIVIALAGIVLLPLPGPGMLIVAFGALLMAEGSRTVAGALDALELRVRPLFLRLLAKWRGIRGRGANSKDVPRPLQRSGSR
jgi:hypothetical protein